MTGTEHPRSRSILGRRLKVSDDRLAEAVRRIGVLGFAIFALGLTGFLLGTLLRQDVDLRGVERPFWAFGIMSASGLMAWVVARHTRASTNTKVFVGLAHLALMGLAYGFWRHWIPYFPGDMIRGPSAATIYGVLFAAMVPVRLKWLTIGLFSSVALELLVMPALVLGLDYPVPSRQVFMWLIIPNFAGAAVALYIARIMHQLGSKVDEAQELGAYALEEKLGEGAMGEVWKATHRMLARPTAVKLVKPELLRNGDAEPVLQAFIGEASLTAQLHSPHLVTIFDAGITDDGQLYYAMELLDGEDLQQLIEKEGPMPLERALPLLIQAADVLARVHATGLLHRDIKPANLFVSRTFEGSDHLKLLDFGLVEALDTSNSPEALSKRPVLGTAAYMPPEVALREPVDVRTDLYAFGCCAYAVLSGGAPFRYATPLQAIIAHVSEGPVPLRDVAPDVPPDLADVIERCMAKRLGDRPASAAEVATALRAAAL